MELFFKTATGWEDKTLSLDECIKWFKDNTDEDGNVNDEVLIFKDAGLKVNTDKTINWTLSDSSIDRDRERFDTSGWNLKEFKKNPVLQWSHDATIPAIGKVINPKIKEERLVGKIEFDSEDAFAQKIERKVRAGYISAGSVGFFPMQVEIPEDDKSDLQLIYRKQELREFSICNVPANPNALVEQPEKEMYSHVEGTPPNPKTITITGSTTDKPFLFGPDTNVESIKADIEEMATEMKAMQLDIENLKTMQIDMSDKITKDDTDFYHQLFNEKKPSNQEGLKTFSEKSVDEIFS